MHTLKTITFLLLIAACAPIGLATESQRICLFDGVTIRSDFSGGRIDACEEVKKNHYKLVISPEDTPPINTSPWYAFTAESDRSAKVTVDITYTYHKHRYWPKTSNDGKTWTRMEEADVHVNEDGSASLSLNLTPSPRYIAGQEIMTAQYHYDWSQMVANTYGMAHTKIGQSKEGRTIEQLETAAGQKTNDYIFIVGRQHPPEVTGALALVAFSEEVMGDSALAKQFRQAFGVIIVPMLNPDGVENGHWRHNMGSKDLNRDWGPFSQPETQLMRDALERFRSDDKLWLFLDFHSTGRNVLYTQATDEITTPRAFAGKWSERVKNNPAAYEFERAERPLTELPTSKNYVFSNFGVPAITYEVGDETDRDDIDTSARIFAQEMMKILLEEKRAQNASN